MNAVQINFSNRRDASLRDSVTEVINAKIQKADYELKKFMADLQKPNQKPGRPDPNDTSWIDSQKHVFQVIENSSRLTTKLLYLRMRLTEYNSTQILQLISSDRLKELSLQEIKDEIK